MKKLFVVVSVALMLLVAGAPALAATTTYNCAAMADARLDQRDPGDNFGTGTTMKIVGDPLSTEVVRSIIRFNIPSFVSPGQIQSAVLHLNGRSGDDVAINIHPVTAYWYEKDLFEPDTTQLIWGATWNSPGGDWSGYTWATAGGDFDAAESQAATIASGWNTIDITTLLTDNLDTIRKFGIMMKLQDETLDQFRSIYSRDNADRHPYLELVVDLGLPGDTYLCPVTSDIYIDSGRDYNLNFKTRVLVSWHPTYGTSRGLWHFEIPPGISEASIESATMHISGSEHSLSLKTFDVDLSALNTPFDEETDTWASLSGGDYDAGVTSTGSLPGTLNPAMTNWYAALDVTTLLAGNLDKVRNNGVLMKQTTEGVAKLHQNIASREAYDPTDVAAYLEINVKPTLISLASLEAVPGCGSVTLQWSTDSEIHNAGFNIYRAEQGGEFVKINAEIIPAQGGPLSGAAYEFVDASVKNRTAYTYKLEDIDSDGTATMHGPVSATPRLIYLVK